MLTKKYSYGAKTPSTQAEAVGEQMNKAHQYRNALVELERTRRTKVEQTLREMFPHLVELDEAIGAKEGELGGLREGIAKRNATVRKRTGTQEEREAVKTIKGTLKELR